MQLAIREIRRAKARFGLLCGAVGLLIFLILFQQALLNGLVTDFVGAVENSDSPVLVFNDQARANVEGSFLYPDQVAAVASVQGVAEASPIGQNTFTAGTTVEPEPLDAVLFGYELGGLGAPTALSSGRLPAGDLEAVASASDADKGFDIGDMVTIVGDTVDVEITVVGLADESRWSVAPTMFVSYPTFEAAIRAVNPRAEAVLASLVAVAPGPGIDLDVLTDRIDAEVGGVEALTNAEAIDRNPGVAATTQSFNIVLTLAFAVVVVVVGFFFLILTVQKARSLTLLRAIGAPPRYLVTNLLAQIGFVMAVGSVIGVAATTAVFGTGPSSDLSVSLSPGTIARTLVALVVLAMIAGFAAIRRVLRIDPMRATIPGSIT